MVFPINGILCIICVCFFLFTYVTDNGDIPRLILWSWLSLFNLIILVSSLIIER